MNELITFFRNRQHDPGREWRIETEGRLLYFYSKTYLEASAYRQELSDTASYPAYKDLIEQAIGQQGGGGMLAEASPANGGWRLEVKLIGPHETNAYQPPASVFHIEHGGELAESLLEQGGPTSLALPANAHVILPVDKEAEEHFRAYRVHFAMWFPADFESAMLNLLRRPSLDLRLERLERLADSQPDKRLAQAPWVWAGLGATSGILLALLASFSLGLFDRTAPLQTLAKESAPDLPANKEPSAPPTETPVAAPPKAENTHAEPIHSEALVQALQSLGEIGSTSGNDADRLCLLSYLAQQLDADGKLGLKTQLQAKNPSLDFQSCPNPQIDQVTAGINKLVGELAQAPASAKPNTPPKRAGKPR